MAAGASSVPGLLAPNPAAQELSSEPANATTLPPNMADGPAQEATRNRGPVTPGYVHVGRGSLTIDRWFFFPLVLWRWKIYEWYGSILWTLHRTSSIHGGGGRGGGGGYWDARREFLFWPLIGTERGVVQAFLTPKRYQSRQNPESETCVL